MPRYPRVVIPDQPLHLIQRGNNRAAIFAAAEDYQTYLRMLLAASQRSGCAIHAYVLMPNHVHMLMTPDREAGPALMMQHLGRRYVRYFNTRHGRTGTLWEGRYRSTLIDSQRYFFVCSRYIELNPLRAAIVKDAGHYQWSSYAHNGHGERDPLITPHALYQALGSRPAERRRAYQALFPTLVPPDALGAIRRATKRGTVLGETDFRERIAGALERNLARLQHGGDRRSQSFNDSDPLIGLFQRL